MRSFFAEQNQLLQQNNCKNGNENYPYPSWQSVNNHKKWKKWSFVQCVIYFHLYVPFITFYNYLLTQER